jgi:cytochrome b561
MFLTLLPAGSIDRETYTRAHESLGLLVLAIAVMRLAWLVVSPPPQAA